MRIAIPENRATDAASPRKLAVACLGVVIVAAWVAVGATALESLRLQTMLTHASTLPARPAGRTSITEADRVTQPVVGSLRPLVQARIRGLSRESEGDAMANARNIVQAVLSRRCSNAAGLGSITVREAECKKTEHGWWECMVTAEAACEAGAPSQVVEAGAGSIVAPAASRRRDVEAAATPAEESGIAGIRAGRYSPLPPDEILPNGGDASAADVQLTNSTRYRLRVFVSGPAERTLTLEPNATRSVEVPSGDYEIAGEIEGGDGASFYGEHSYAAGGRYRQDFQESFLVRR